MLNKNIHNDKLLKSYLLYTVNSIYKLDQSYLSIAEPIRSVADIPDSASNYLVIGHEATENILKNSTEISPKNYATVHILHVR